MLNQAKFGIRYKDASLNNLLFETATNEKILKWIKTPYEKKGFLVVLGGTGTGKTYLCSAMVNYLKEQNKNFCYFTDADFIKALKEKMKEGIDTKQQIQNFCESASLFILDDVGSIRLTEWEIEQIHYLIEEEYKNKKPMIFISNYSETELVLKFAKSTISRLFNRENTIIEIQGPDLRQIGY